MKRLALFSLFLFGCRAAPEPAAPFETEDVTAPVANSPQNAEEFGIWRSFFIARLASGEPVWTAANAADVAFDAWAIRTTTDVPATGGDE